MKILKSLAILLMWLIFHPLVILTFLLRLLNTDFVTLSLSKYVNDEPVQSSGQDFSGLICKSSF